MDHFLFVSKTGYSEYFASAMVVLLRSAGVPARLAVGFVSSEYDKERGAFVARDVHAHGWAEVFFPEYGWVEFEPTPYQPLLPEAPFGVTEGAGELSDEFAYPFLGEELDAARPAGALPSRSRAVHLIAEAYGHWLYGKRKASGGARQQLRDAWVALRAELLRRVLRPR